MRLLLYCESDIYRHRISAGGVRTSTTTVHRMVGKIRVYSNVSVHLRAYMSVHPKSYNTPKSLEQAQAADRATRIYSKQQERR